jgi:hypothetical protein
MYPAVGHANPELLLVLPVLLLLFDRAPKRQRFGHSKQILK